MVYNANIPQPGDILSDSQNDLLNNFAQLNTSFGIDHYPFTDNSVNLGEHNQVTQPQIIGAAHPATAAGQCKLYNMNDLAAIGSLQYSRGPSNAVPSPLTYLQSPAGAISLNLNDTTNVIDLNGIGVFCSGFIIANWIKQSDATVQEITTTYFQYNQSGNVTFLTNTSSVTASFQTSGNTLIQIKNTSGFSGFIRWTLQFYRIQN